MAALPLEDWIHRYGEAWVARDPEAFVALFSTAANYYWTPFENPLIGPAQIAAAFTDAVSTQRNIDFGFRLLSQDDEGGIAHWRCSFSRVATDMTVTIDGIMTVALNPEGMCDEFREWWHSDESA